MARDDQEDIPLANHENAREDDALAVVHQQEVKEEEEADGGEPEKEGNHKFEPESADPNHPPRQPSYRGDARLSISNKDKADPLLPSYFGAPVKRDWRLTWKQDTKNYIINNKWFFIGMTVAFLSLLFLGIYSSHFHALKWKGWFSLALVVFMVGFLSLDLLASHILLGAVLGIFIILDCVSPSDGIRGFGNTGVATVALLFIVSEGITRTNALGTAFRYLVSNRTDFNITWVYFKVCMLLSLLSAFLNNTPLYVMSAPVLIRWCRTVRLAPSKVLMPISTAIVLGGTITLIGTSTNVVVAGLAQADAKLLDQTGKRMYFSLFGIAPMGLFNWAVGILYVIFLSARILPSREDESLDEAVKANLRSFLVAVRVHQTAKSVVGKTVELGGLCYLPGLALVELHRDGEVHPAPAKDFTVIAGDVLFFTGEAERAVDLFKQEPGLVAISDKEKAQLFNSERHAHSMYEAVIATNSSLNGKYIKEVDFLGEYGAQILAVSHVRGGALFKLDDVQLQSGDTLLLEANDAFQKRFQHDKTFSLVYALQSSKPPRNDMLHVAVAIVIIITMICTAAGDVPAEQGGIFTTGIAAIFLMLFTGCLTLKDMDNAVDIPVMLRIAFEVGVGRAIEVNGVGNAIGGLLVKWLHPLGRGGIYAAIYVAVALLTEVLTNNGACTIMYPVVAGIIKSKAIPTLNPYAALYVLMLGGSASFLTPIGYQLNLLATAQARYTFADWPRYGAILKLLCFFSTVFAAIFFYD